MRIERLINHTGMLAVAAHLSPQTSFIDPSQMAVALNRLLSTHSGIAATGFFAAFSRDSARIGVDVSVRPIDQAFPLTQVRTVQRWKTDHERANQYRSSLAEGVLAVILTTFWLSDPAVVDRILVNLNLPTVNPATGQDEMICVTSVEVSRADLAGIDFSRVEPEACLRALNSVVPSRSGDIEAVRPLAIVKSLDPRYIDATEIAAGLESRPNLMELTPTEFESLIQNLFQAMGLDTHQTQASRDGGVDAVAYDERPVVGGKVVIQAKRYKNTVGVSAVRDLYGTLMNEGASKGILVSTSGYGGASFDFARNKPIELVDGGNLLYLLAEHLKLSAVIEAPETWVEPLHEIG